MISPAILLSLLAQQTTPPPAWSVGHTLIHDAGTYTEAPVFMDGDLYFVGAKVATVYSLAADGTLTTVLDEFVGANGLAVAGDGVLLAAGTQGVATVRIGDDGTGTIESWVRGPSNGQSFVWPNDLLTDGEGGYWLTDSGSRTEDTGAVYHVDAEGTVLRVAQGLGFANGLIRSPDGGTLYVDQSTKNNILAFPIQDDMSLGSARVLLTMPPEELYQAKHMPDGMCQAPDGTMLVAHNGTDRLRMFDPQGRILASYATGLMATSNCAIGPDGAVYVTGAYEFETKAGGITRLDLGFSPQ